MDDKNNAKLADFGLCNFQKSGEFLKTSCGSSNYAAPEVLSVQGYDGFAADIWSLGVILLTMLTGSLVFNNTNISKLHDLIKEGDYTMPEQLSDSVKDLINRILQPLPVKRINVSEIKQHAWVKDQILTANACFQTPEAEIYTQMTAFSKLKGLTLEAIKERVESEDLSDPANSLRGIFEFLKHDKFLSWIFHQKTPDFAEPKCRRKKISQNQEKRLSTIMGRIKRHQMPCYSKDTQSRKTSFTPFEPKGAEPSLGKDF